MSIIRPEHFGAEIFKSLTARPASACFASSSLHVCSIPSPRTRQFPHSRLLVPSGAHTPTSHLYREGPGGRTWGCGDGKCRGGRRGRSIWTTMYRRSYRAPESKARGSSPVNCTLNSSAMAWDRWSSDSPWHLMPASPRCANS